MVLNENTSAVIVDSKIVDGSEKITEKTVTTAAPQINDILEQDGSTLDVIDNLKNADGSEKTETVTTTAP